MILTKITDPTQIYMNSEIYALTALAFHSPTHGKIKGAVESLYTKQQGKFYIAKIDDEIVGIIGAKRIDNSYLELNHLVVKESFRHQGIAKKMIREMLQTENVAEITAQCDEYLKPFFTHCGFKVWVNPDEVFGGQDYLCCLKR